jgi:hypothetical protein
VLYGACQAEATKSVALIALRMSVGLRPIEYRGTLIRHRQELVVARNLVVALVCRVAKCVAILAEIVRNRIHRQLADEFRDDELQRIPLLPRGHRLEQGATYFDLCVGREFCAIAKEVVDRDGCFVAKSDVDYELWNRLIHVRYRRPTRGRGAHDAARRVSARTVGSRSSILLSRWCMASSHSAA